MFAIIDMDGAKAELYIKELIKSNYNGAPKETAKIGEGSFGLVYRAIMPDGRKVVFKAYRVRGMHRAQATEPRTLAEYSKLPVPEIYALYDADGVRSVDIAEMEFMEGVPAASVNPYFRSRKKRKAMAETIVDSLLAINAATRDKYGLVAGEEEYDSCTWLLREDGERNSGVDGG